MQPEAYGRKALRVPLRLPWKFTYGMPYAAKEYTNQRSAVADCPSRMSWQMTVVPIRHGAYTPACDQRGDGLGEDEGSRMDVLSDESGE